MDSIKALFVYDSISGTLSRRLKGGALRKAGTVSRLGYLKVRVDGKDYQVHRIAFLLMTGAFPTEDVDHINGVRSDNRWGNLRAVNRSVNGQNRTARNSNANSYPAGTMPHGRKWIARITIKRKKCYLGLYSTAAEAHAAYLKAKQEYIDGNC